MLPEGWKKTLLSEVAEIRTGVAKNERITGNFVELPYLRVANVQDGHIELTEIKTIKIEKNKIDRYLLQPGDVLMTEGGDFDKLGRGDVWKGDISLCLHQNHIFAVRPNPKKLNSIFLAALSSSYYGRQYFLSCAKRSTNLASINSTQLKNFPILLPSLEEQHAIVEILSTWNKAISTADAMLENSRRQKKALMQQLLTGKRRLPGFRGEWKTVRVGKVICEESMRNRGSRVTRVLSVTNQKGFVLPEEQFSKRVASENIENYKIIKRGQFGYNPSRLNVGSFGRLDRFEEGILSPLYVIFSLRDTYINSDFFFSWMQAGETRQRIKRSTQGSVRESVSFDALAEFPLLLPALDEQRAIAAVLDAADREITLLEQKAARLREEKKALMQQLLTGKRRVRI